MLIPTITCPKCKSKWELDIEEDDVENFLKYLEKIKRDKR